MYNLLDSFEAKHQIKISELIRRVHFKFIFSFFQWWWYYLFIYFNARNEYLITPQEKMKRGASPNLESILIKMKMYFTHFI